MVMRHLMVNINSIPLHYLHYCIMTAKTAFTVLLDEKSKCNHIATDCIICIIRKSYLTIKIISYLWVMANKVGRPSMFSDPEDMQRLIDEYFELIREENEPATITGLCLHLGFESRQSFYEYGEKKEFTYTIKRARLMIENAYERNLSIANSPTGSIFALKNLGWSDKTEIDNTHHIGDFKISDVIKFSDKDG